MKSRKLTIGLFLFYLVALAWVVLLKLRFSFDDLDHFRSINLIPFAGLGIFNGTMSIRDREIISNVLVFIPYGIFVCMLMGKKGFRKIIPIFLTSLVFEISQFVFAIGAADITDVLGNTIGGVIGIGIFSVLSKIFKGKTCSVINGICLIAAIVLVLLYGLIFLANR